jgi:hypothetical protein
MLNWVVSTFFTSYLFDDFHNVDLSGTSHDATATSDAAWPPIFGNKSALFMVIAELHPIRPVFPEVLTPRHQGVFFAQTGIPHLLPLAGHLIQIELVVHIIAVAGGADHGAGPTAQTLVAQVFPGRASVFHFHDPCKVPQLHIQLEGLVPLIGSSLILLDIAASDLLE